MSRAMALDLSYAAAGSQARDDEDDALVTRLRDGDPAALGEAYDRHHAHVRAFARRFVGDDASAEDVVQETFVALPRTIGRFCGGATLRSFLVGVAINHARHHVRAATRRRAAMDRLTSEPVTGGRTPEAEAEGAQLARALVRALDALSLDHRAAFVLCEVEERSSIEAAEILGVPEGTVRTRLMHAKKRLRAWFEREGAR